jgi:hypothetical protein
MGAAQQKDSIVWMIHAYRAKSIIPLLVQRSSICICIYHLEQILRICHLQQTIHNSLKGIEQINNMEYTYAAIAVWVQQ